jgi:hypothetical protein
MQTLEVVGASDPALRGHVAAFVDEDEVFTFVVFLAGGEVSLSIAAG